MQFIIYVGLLYLFHQQGCKRMGPLGSKASARINMTDGLMEAEDQQTEEGSEEGSGDSENEEPAMCPTRDSLAGETRFIQYLAGHYRKSVIE